MRILSKYEKWAMAPCADANRTRERTNARKKRGTLVRKRCVACQTVMTANLRGVCNGCLATAGNTG